MYKFSNKGIRMTSVMFFFQWPFVFFDAPVLGWRSGFGFTIGLRLFSEKSDWECDSIDSEQSS